MTGKALLIAFHFPPIRHSSGIQRTLNFAAQLRGLGWQPTILTVHPRVYESIGYDQMDEIPDDVTVIRAFALDAKRHLSIRGRYWEVTARPDRYAPWWFGGVWSGFRLLRRVRPHVIWSTSPVGTAHNIARSLHKVSGLPWVADFRDPLTEDEYPPDPKTRERLRRFEGSVLSLCTKAVVTTKSTLRMHQRRFPDVPRNKWIIIPNGYDEQSFAAVERQDRPGKEQAVITLVHSGILYPQERDPRPFFEAVSRLKKMGLLGSANTRIVLRATCYDDIHAPMLDSLGIADIVSLEPPVGYSDALREMIDASGLLLFQGSVCNHQIPAKLYEYMRSGRPILALTDPGGDTAQTYRDSGGKYLSPLDDAGEITEVLGRFLAELRQGTAKGTTRSIAQQYSRETGARRLAEIFEEVASTKNLS